MTPAQLKASLAIPMIAAPMLRVSSPDLVVACCAAGVVGSIPMFNADSASAFEQLLGGIEDRLRELGPAGTVAPHAVNIVLREREDPRFAENRDILLRHQPPIVISSVGHPGDLAADVHAYGGLIFHDVATMRHAEKAIEAGVDGLILLTHGAGGHTGSANPFAFVRNVRRIWDGMIALAGCIGDGAALRAAEILGADFGYVGTRFAATRESWAPPRYRSLMQEQQMADVIVTERISGLKATFMRGSIVEAGLDPENLPMLRAPYKPQLPPGIRAWHNVWSAGQGVGLIDTIPTAADLIAEMKRDYAGARAGDVGHGR